MSDPAPCKVHVLYEYSSGDTPHGCSLIRLLRPLSHPDLAPYLQLSAGTGMPLNSPDLVIIERFWNQHCDIAALDDLVVRLREQGVAVIAELDDDLLTLGSNPDDGTGPTAAQKMWLRRLLRVADGVMVSTPLLAERVRSLNPLVEVVPNALDERLFLQQHDRTSQRTDRITFGYMGTYTHSDDLISVIGPLRRVLARHGNRVAFELVGVGSTQLLEEAFRGIPVIIRQVPVADVHYENFPAWMHANIRWDFGIAPLLDSPFSRSKSDIKFLDYGVQGIPGIFSRVPAYSGTVRHLQNGLLAATAAEWEDALELMITDAQTRMQLATAVHREVWEKRMLKTQAGRWREAINRIMGHRSRRTHVQPATRNEKLLAGCNLAGVGLEIGPSFSPVAPKKAGYRVEVLDHAPAELLREKYKDQNVDISNIEAVDYVWSGEPLHQLTGKQDYYDWIIASHVIEHTPDLVSFLQQCQTMLKPGGLLCLAVSDHRYCFDVCRPVSTPGSVIQAFLEQRTRHTAASVWDHFSMIMKKGDLVSWQAGHPGAYSLIHPDLDDARAMLEQARRSDQYLDVHNWVFTPASFSLIMHDLHAVRYTTLQQCVFFPTEGCEFIVQLQKEEGKTDPLPDPELRKRLLLALLEEQAN